MQDFILIDRLTDFGEHIEITNYSEYKMFKHNNFFINKKKNIKNVQPKQLEIRYRMD
jgi:hypothetical protein